MYHVPPFPFAQFPGETKLFCTYSFAHGPDWAVIQVSSPLESPRRLCTPRLTIQTLMSPLPLPLPCLCWFLQGVDVGVSQLSQVSDGLDGAARFVWNFPVDVTF